MPLRLIEIVVPEDFAANVRELLEGHEVLDMWESLLSDGRIASRILVATEKSEAVMDALEHRLSHLEVFRIALITVEATLPRPEPKKKQDAEQEVPAEAPPPKFPERVSREELYGDIEMTSRLTGSYLALAALSAIVAAVGILKSNVAIVIGAMVIAPLLGPNVALALATTLGDADLAARSIWANAAGIFVALAIAAILGAALKVDPNIPEIASRTRVGLADITIALAAGGAATLAFTKGLSSALIGVMVAVALLPPLVTLGLLAGAGLWQKSLGAFLLLAANLICINLAGVTSFLAQGIRPSSWWEAKRARKATRNAIVIWTFLLLLLVAVILLSKRG